MSAPQKFAASGKTETLDLAIGKPEKPSAGREWRLVAPIQDLADPDEVARLLNTLRNLQARAFPATGLPDESYGLDPPAVEVTIASGPDRIPGKLRFGRGTLPSNQGQVFARRAEPEGPVAKILSYQMRAVNKIPSWG